MLVAVGEPVLFKGHRMVYSSGLFGSRYQPFRDHSKCQGEINLFPDSVYRLVPGLCVTERREG